MAKPARKAKRGRSSRAGPKAARGAPSRRSITRRPVRIALTAGAAALLGGLLWATLADRSSEGSAESRGLLKAGEELYAVHCASCHGASLEGQDNWRTQLPDGAYPPAPPHDASGHTWHHPDSQLFEITKFGGQASAPTGFQSAMPAFEDVLSDADIWAVLEFIKSRWPAKEGEYQKQVTRRSRSQ